MRGSAVGLIEVANREARARCTKMEEHAEDARESRPAPENLRCLRTTIRVAQKVGKGLGARQDVLGSL